jgi:hypothetical protein
MHSESILIYVEVVHQDLSSLNPLKIKIPTENYQIQIDKVQDTCDKPILFYFSLLSPLSSNFLNVTYIYIILYSKF